MACRSADFAANLDHGRSGQNQPRHTLKSSNTALAIVPAPIKAQRCGLAICIALFAVFCTVIPFARVALPRVEAFIPIYDSTLALNNFVTAGLLLVGFSRSRLHAVLVLASGYLFTSLMALPHMAAFPGLFSSNGLLGAGPQTSAWLNVFRQGVFPLVVVSYAVLKSHQTKTVQPAAATSADVVPAAAAVLACVCLLTLLATSGHYLLPRIVDGDRYTSAMMAVSVLLCASSLVALAILGLRPPYSIIDLWLMVVLCAWVLGMVLSMVINNGRFDLGSYAGRIYGLFAASVVPIVFLVEAGRLWGRLDEARAIADQRNAELVASREQLA